MFRATMCPSSGADDCVMCWYVPWPQEGGQDRLAGSASMEISQQIFIVVADIKLH